MKCALILPVAGAVFALALTPALAKQPRDHARYANPYAYTEPGPQWNGPDPSFGNRAGINGARTYGRCVEDLGYGRYEYCD
jgi:hypothetical protein